MISEQNECYVILNSALKYEYPIFIKTQIILEPNFTELFCGLVIHEELGILE